MPPLRFSPLDPCEREQQKTQVGQNAQPSRVCEWTAWRKPNQHILLHEVLRRKGPKADVALETPQVVLGHRKREHHDALHDAAGKRAVEARKLSVRSQIST